jgi:hypothetical protein
VIDRDVSLFGEDDEALEKVLELADVARQSHSQRDHRSSLISAGVGSFAVVLLEKC